MSKQAVWVNFLPNLDTKKGKLNEKPKVTRFKIAEVVLACSKPMV